MKRYSTVLGLIALGPAVCQLIQKCLGYLPGCWLRKRRRKLTNTLVERALRFSRYYDEYKILTAFRYHRGPLAGLMGYSHESLTGRSSLVDIIGDGAFSAITVL